MGYQDLTQHELDWLKYRYNLSDWHCHQWQSESQKKIIEKLPQLWYEAESLKQHQLDELFLDTFFTHQNQRSALETPSMLTYASSISIVITANYMMKKNLSTTLMTPCFDNLADIFKWFNIPLQAIEEEKFHEPEQVYKNLCEWVKTDALFIVDVNNPTWFSLIKSGKKVWDEIIRYCIEYDKVLIIDFCFAPLLNFDPDCEVFDIYKMLIESWVRYIAYEDTGKVWPVQDAKVSILKASMDMYHDLYNIKTTYILNVSPFILRFLIEYLRVSEQTWYSDNKHMLETNTNAVKKYLDNTILEYIPSQTFITVAWCKIKKPWVRATDLQKYLADRWVYTLPWTYFFRNDHELGESYIRLALSRDGELFEQSMIHLQKWLQKFEKDSL
jgi:aspartate/methionine/tyrosine aminotransferase